MRGIPPILLALDTSTRTVGLALYDGAQVLYETAWTSQDYHTVELAPAIGEAFERTGLKMAALAAVTAATGPGSFTGLRVGLALAKGLVFARKLALVGVPTLDALAAAQPLQPGLPLLAALRAGRGRLAVCAYHAGETGWQSDGAIEVVTLEGLAARLQEPACVAGELSEDERRWLAEQRPQARLASPAQSLRRPAYLAELGWRRWQAGQTDDPAGLAPIYIHYNDPIPV
jgi:tRNA threonylcarbamoyladenosine biosynthesis protein TsaB